MMQAQAQAQAQAREQEAMSEVQKQQALADTQAQLKKVDMELSLQKMQVELNHKMQMAELQHQYDMQLKQMDIQKDEAKEQMIEERKDKRTRIQGTQQSQMIAQRNNDSAPIDFEKGSGPGQENLAASDFIAT